MKAFLAFVIGWWSVLAFFELKDLADPNETSDRSDMVMLVIRVALIAWAAVLLTACGGGDDDDSAPPGPHTVTIVSPPCPASAPREVCR